MRLMDKIKGALYSVAVGDALGAPAEFMSAEQIKNKYGKIIDMVGGGWLNVSPGEVTDDTAMTIAVAKGIIENPQNPIPTIGKYFQEWLDTNPKDIGQTCNSSICYAQRGETKKAWHDAAKKTKNDIGRADGNGSLMRTVFPALYYKDRQNMREAVSDIAEMTHRSDVSTELCIKYCSDIADILDGQITKKDLRVPDPSTYSPTGYVVDTYNCVMKAIMETDSFENALIYAVNGGGDADTIGAIAGGLAGAIYGYDSIPDLWTSKLDSEVCDRLDLVLERCM